MQRIDRINPWRRVYDCPSSKDPFVYGVPHFALYLDVEPTSNCNFDCLFCVNQQMKRKKGFMKIELFEEICRQADNYDCEGIRFLRWGEPLLHPDIVEMVKIAKKHGLLTHITTNGYPLDKNLSELLIRAGLDSIIVSMQGTTPEEYSRLRGKNNYSIVKKNIFNFMKIREDRKNPFVTISTTVTDESEKEIDQFIKRWKKIVDDVCWGYTWFSRLQGINKYKAKEFIERAKELPHNFKCIEVQTKLSIDWDGVVSPCCLDYDRQLSIGHVNDDLLWLWKSPQAQAIRTLLSQKRQDIFTLCSVCRLNYPFRGKNE